MTDRVLRIVLQPVNIRSGAGQIRRELDSIQASARRSAQGSRQATDTISRGAGKIGRNYSQAARDTSRSAGRIGESLNRAGREARKANTSFQSLGTAGRAARASASGFADLGEAASRARQRAEGAGESVQKSGRRAKRAAGAFKDLGNALRGVIAAVAVRQVARVVDEYTNVQNRLRLIVQESEDLAGLTGEIVAQANEVGVAYTEQASLVSRIARANDTIGASGRDILSVSRAVAQTFALSGAGAQETAAATLQLGQALASGRLQGDELRSILENNSVLARSIADGLGVGVGQLRDLGSEGKLTSDVVFRAILRDADNLQERFETFTPTLAQGATALENSISTAIGQIDAAAGSSEAIAIALQEAASAVETDLVPNFIIAADTARAVFSLVFADIGRVVAEVNAAIEGIASRFASIRDLDNPFAQALDSIIDGAGDGATALKELVGAAFGDESLATAPFRAALDAIIALDEETEDASQAQRELAQALREADVAESARADILEQAIRRREELQDEARRRREGLSDGADLGPEVRDDGARALTEAQQDARDAAGELVEALREQARELQITREAGEFAGEALRNLEITQLAAAGATEEQLASLRAANQALSEQEGIDRQAEAFADLREEAQALALAVETPAESLRRTVEEINALAAATDGSGEPLLSLEQRLRAIDAASGDYLDTIANSEDDFDQFAEFATQAARSTQQAFADFLFDPFQDGLDGLLSSFLDTLRQIAANQLANSILSALGNAAGGGGGGGFLGALSGLVGGRFNGGTVQGGRPYLVGEDSAGRGGELFVPPPGGGRILSQRQTADTMAGAGGGDAGGTVVIVEQDPQAVVAALGTAAGRSEIVRAVQADPDTYRAILGVPT